MRRYKLSLILGKYIDRHTLPSLYSISSPKVSGHGYYENYEVAWSSHYEQYHQHGSENGSHLSLTQKKWCLLPRRKTFFPIVIKHTATKCELVALCK